MNRLLVLFCALLFVFSAQSQVLTPQQILEKAQASSVIILTGEGAGRLKAIATGVVITTDGQILTALHAVKGAQEVQVRLANGDVSIASSSRGRTSGETLRH